MKRSLRLAICALTVVPMLTGCRAIARKAAETAIESMGGTVNSAASASAKADAAYVKSLAPLPSGSGLIVCDAVPDAALRNQTAWSAGAARWLQVRVGGQGELGKTQLWGVPEDARRRLGYANWQLDGKRADTLGKSCGVTHIAVGTLSGTPAQATLTYQLREVKAGVVVGTATISGPMAQLTAQLPALARSMASQLQVKAALPTQIALSAGDLTFLGTPDLKPGARAKPLAPAAQKRMNALVARDPLAGIMAQRWCSYPTDAGWQSVGDALIKSAPSNALVWAEVASRGPIRIVPVGDKLAALQAKHPDNYLLAQAGTALEDGNRARPLQVSWAERAVRAAPQSSYAWIRLAESLFDQSEALRRSRYSSDISRAEWSKLNALYAKYYSAALQATVVAPDDAFAWAELAQAATFGGDSTGAGKALETALKLDSHNPSAWGWGMEMTQPKWSGDINKFVAFANRAASHADDFRFPAERVSNVFSSNNVRPQLKAVLQTVVAKDPKNAEALAELGAFYHYEDRSYKKAETLYRQALKADPKYGRAMSYLGDLTYWVHNDSKGAEALYLSAIAADPKDGYFHANLGRMYALTGRPAQGAAQANAAKKLGFSDRTHPVWDATGVKAPGRF